MFFLPKLETLQRTVKTESSFRGLDARAAASERSLADCVNLSAAAFPVLSVCNPLETVKTVSGADYDLLLPGNDEMLEIFGENPVRIRRHFFHADGSIAEAECLLEAGEAVASAVSFHGDLIVLAKKPDRIRLCRFDADGAEIKTVDMSDLLDVSVSGTLGLLTFSSRLVIYQNDQIHICYHGSMEKWTEYFPESDTFYPLAAQHIQLAGSSFIGGISYRSRPVLFKKNAMYQLYQEAKPFELVKVADVGCINPRSLAVCDGVLCFLSADGLMAYTGSGLPTRVSDCLPELAAEAATASGCALGNCYYIGSYVYCFGSKEWSKLKPTPEGKELTAACCYDGRGYFLKKSDGTATLYRYHPNRLDAAIEPTAWSFTTQEFHEKEPGKKKLTQIAFRAEPEQAAMLRVEISIDGREWQSLCSETFSENGARELRLKTPPGENFRLRFSGTGKLSIAYIRRVYHILSDGKIHPFI